MMPVSALGPTEWMIAMLMPGVVILLIILFCVRVVRRLNECHAMLCDLVREKRVREQNSPPPMR